MLNIGKNIRSLIKPLKNNKKAIDEVTAKQEKVINDNFPFYIKESYKHIRTNLIFTLPVEGCKKIILTSSVASEGKSTTSINLAITFAETGAKVLLVDCDLRKPNIAKLVNKKNSKGLSNYLVNLCSEQDIINKSDYKNLDLIFSGDIPPNPAELLGSQRMNKLLDDLSPYYDYIFLDTPPVTLVTDTTILSGIASGIVLVVRQDYTEKDSVKDAIYQLEFVKAKILGVILNDSSVGSSKNYKYRYKYRYKYK